ncbi:MAG: hypothetical protein DGJ47_000831, partial [Rickettsiaceae bacterium]
DETLCDKIVRNSGDVNDFNILEIGPGPAGLTRSILKAKPRNLTVIETDERCMPLLEEIRQVYPNLQIINNDALKIRLKELSKGDIKLKIIANLPYNIGCKLITNWLEEIETVETITVMLQKEVVDRMVAKPNSKAYGRLSIFCQMLCDVSKCFDVSPKAFYPEPKVTSAIIHLKPKTDLPSKEISKIVEKITLHGFNNRRKMLRSSLKKIIPNIDDIFLKLNISSAVRAEDLRVEDYIQMAALIIQTGQHPQ